MYSSILDKDTIIALATPQGTGAIAVIRLSGPEAIGLCDSAFRFAGKASKKLSEQPGHTLHFGYLYDGEVLIDEVLVSLFTAPRSYTRENVVEISCHGSQYIAQRIIRMFVAKGARLARPGEFTQRAFLNGQLDLAQAEAVADLIAAETEAAHQAAIHQIRGGFSRQIAQLREKLIDFASLIELELDFGEEDVEFANRDDLRQLVSTLRGSIEPLIDSFRAGNVIKNGVPTVIAGKPNAGKSTLLNALLNEEKAIVSDIPGTTRDFIEDELLIGGVIFRFIDTAGLRENTADQIEAIGVQRTQAKMKEASLIIYLFDLSNFVSGELMQEVNRLENLGKPFILVANKADKGLPPLPEALQQMQAEGKLLCIAAAMGQGIELLKEQLLATINQTGFSAGSTIVTNSRHHESLLQTDEALLGVLQGLDRGISGDFLAMDIRTALHHLGEITGSITTDDLLANIFSNFCIGK